MKRITQQEFDNLPVNEYGIKICPGFTDYSDIKIIKEWCSFAEGCSFAERCSFAKRCSFAEGCSFAERCSFKQIAITMLLSQLGKTLPNTTLELMRRDAQFHPNPEKFDEWAKGGPCPYSNCICQRVYHFEHDATIWQPGKPTMSDYELFMAIAKEKNWKIG